MSFAERFLESPTVYRLWQVPFAAQKFRHVVAHSELWQGVRVLDVGCGPGTNCRHFDAEGYLGIDVNPRYIADARRRHQKRFLVADVTTHQFDEGGFDVILVNSFLHHLPDGDAHRLLARLEPLLAAQGHVHILELELPRRSSIARVLARMDRGRYARPFEEWSRLFEDHFKPIVVERFRLGAPLVPLWHMMYFKGGARAE